MNLDKPFAQLPDFPQFRILHISDLHFGAKHICAPSDPSGSYAGVVPLKNLLLEDLRSDDWKDVEWALPSSNLDAPLIIAVTGDLTQKAQPSEFNQAADFLNDLAEASILGSKVGLKNLFVVPGNHDVVFDKADPETRFTPYCNFYNKLFKTIQPILRTFARPDEASSLSRIQAFPEARLLIAEINSCFYVEKETLDESRGQVDAQTIASLRKQLEAFGTRANSWVKIALMHHHPVLLPSFVEPGRGVDSILNAKSLLRLLREHSFQVILHGHKHYPQVFSYDPETAWAASEEATMPQLIVAGGSCGSIELPEATRRCNTYNLITVKWDSYAKQTRVQVITRGLIRTGPDNELDPDRWRWATVRTFDKTLSYHDNRPVAGNFKRIAFPIGGDELEEQRDAEYRRLRFNMPVVEVLPSLEPRQGYEARLWLARHRHHKESPVKVTWSAGKMFERKVCEKDAGPDFCIFFHYWGPMLVQVELEFGDGERVLSYVYARLLSETNRPSKQIVPGPVQLKASH